MILQSIYCSSDADMKDESGSLQMNLHNALELRACMRLAGDNRIR